MCQGRVRRNDQLPALLLNSYLVSFFVLYIV